MSNPPTLFLSYARRQPDESWADRIVGVLRGRFGLDVWFDKRGIRVGHPYDEEIAQAIRGCDALLFLGSSASLTSQVCRQECELAMQIGKPIVPLFIEPVTWAGFPDAFEKLHFEQIFRAHDDDDIAAMAGAALLGVGIAIDPARVPPRKGHFDQWADHIHPAYSALRVASAGELRTLIDDCANKLSLRSEHGYHNLNLALLLLHLKETTRAAHHAELALKNLPSSAETTYFNALIAAAREPLGEAPRARVQRIIELCDTAMTLDAAASKGTRSSKICALALVLKAIVGHEHFQRNGLRAPVGDASELIAEARARGLDRDELDRLARGLVNPSTGARALLDAAARD